MVAAVGRGSSMRRVAARFGVALATVQYWVRRAGSRRLDRVDFSDHPRGPLRPANKTCWEIEERVLAVRRELKETSALGEYGQAAIERELRRRGVAHAPSQRTIGRILERRGALDARRRVRRKAPPPGWYLPRLAGRQAELDSFDSVEGLVIEGGHRVEVLNGVSLHGGLVASWPRAKINAKTVVNALVGHWRRFGLPTYAQFDNDTVFQGSHGRPDTLGRVIRLCLGLGVIPVFAPPRASGFQAAIENFNGRWQAKVWARFHHASRAALQAQSAKFITASRRRAADRIESAPKRRPFPQDWELDLQAPPRREVILIRRTDDKGQVSVLGRTYRVSAHWLHRLVRAEVDFDHHCIRFYTLRRREPTDQPLVRKLPYVFPRRPFHE